jgi:hypothetical protein
MELMAVHLISQNIAWDHLAGVFMFYGGQWDGAKIIPSHYISRVESEPDYIRVVCDTKRHKETILVHSEKVESDVEAINWILSEFA